MLYCLTPMPKQSDCAEQSRQEQADGLENGNHRDYNQQCRNKRQNLLCNRSQTRICHTAGHKQAGAEGRSNETDSQVDAQDHTEMDGIHANGGNDGIQDGNQNDDGSSGIQESTDNQQQQVDLSW